MRNEEKEYVWHDGIRINDAQLVTLAMNAGSYHVAEHYLLSLLAHGVMHHLPDYINKVNQVREFYGVAPIPAPKNNFTEDAKPKKCDMGAKVRRLYLKMTASEHEELLSQCLLVMMANYPNLFKFKNQWQGIYLVMRDRLDYGLSQMDFLAMAAKATPAGWPKRLQISESVIKNFSHAIKMMHADEAYYEMTDNPQRELCDIFWEVLMQQLLTVKYGADTELI